MFAVTELLNTLLDLNIRLSLDDQGGLLVRGEKGKLTAELIARIKALKPEIILLLKSSVQHPPPIKISAITRVGDLNLSYAQQSLWLLAQRDGSSSQFNMPIELRLTGILDENALNHALATIIDRHEALRTCFISDENGEPYQSIQKDPYFHIDATDISSLPYDKQHGLISEIVAGEASKEFDLQSGLMLRAQLLKQSKDEHILLVTMHHIASDEWSISILIKELGAFYSAYVQGNSNPLADLDIQYADYAHWHRQWLQSGVLETEMKYWEHQLANLPVVHSLPLDHARPRVQSFAGQTHRMVIGPAVTEELKRLCQSRGATLLMGLHAVFVIFLSRYSNEKDIVIGSPIANREQAEVANLIGCFANSLVLRSELPAQGTFEMLIDQSKELLLDAYAHQQTPFEQIVERLQPERSLGHSALFQIMLVLRNNEEASLMLPGLTLAPVEQAENCAKYDLTLNVRESRMGLELTWEYNTDVLEGQTVVRMSQHFGVLMESLVNTPQENVFGVAILDESERHQLLVEWNDTAVAYPEGECLHRRFEAQVVRDPEAIAVIVDDQKGRVEMLSYGELNCRANRLAHYLLARGVAGPDRLVGVCMERSSGMLVALLGILKAGAAYVPLDPDYPLARLTYMIADADVDLVLTQQRVLECALPELSRTLCLDDAEVQAQLTGCSEENPSVGVEASHLAYVIYTSGSTGNPKGVMVEHGNLANFLSAMRDAPGIQSEDCLLAVTSISFDIHGLELFLPLSVGAKIILATKAATIDPDQLGALINKYTASIMQATPATWKMLLKGGWQPTSALKILCGGEALSLPLATELLAFADVTLWNMYGPTETTIWSCVKKIQRDELVLMGRPIANTDVYVVSDTMSLVPYGIAGELLIGGAGVTRGYLNRPELTQEKFIANPFATAIRSSSNVKLYRTGDQVRWLANGQLEFLGRIDQQAKIRGFRIELGEIENALLKQPFVKDAVVVVRDIAGEKNLLAYVVPQASINQSETSTLSGNILQESLRNLLPDYMIPSAFFLQEHLPLTPNGKVDRNALPILGLAKNTNSYVAPRTDTEKILCDIWQTVIGVERVGITDNFFKIGGDSLKAMRFISMARDQELNYSVRQLFENNTIADLADLSLKT